MWKEHHHKMRTAASCLRCSLPSYHLLFTKHNILSIILFRLKPRSFCSVVKIGQGIRLPVPQASTRDSLYAMQRSSASHLRHRPSASCAFMWHLTKTSVQHSVSSPTRAEKNPTAAKAPVHCPAPAGCLKNAFTYSSRIAAFHCQKRDKHHPCYHKNHRKAECSYHVINHSLPRTEGILLPLTTQVTEKLSKG